MSSFIALMSLLSMAPGRALAQAAGSGVNCASTELSGEAYYQACGCNNNDNVDKNNCGIIAYLILFINVLSGLVGIVIVTMIVIGGIQYSAARDNPQAAAAAKGRITNAILALLAFLFTFAFLQYIVPGGIL